MATIETLFLKKWIGLFHLEYVQSHNILHFQLMVMLGWIEIEMRGTWAMIIGYPNINTATVYT